MAVPFVAAAAQAAQAVQNLSVRPDQLRAVIGLDGFVDEILWVVDQRVDAQKFTPVATIADFAKRIAAAAGFSTNIELVPHTVKLGGNGPIMALALAKSGAAVTCIGTLGLPEPHPVFAELAQLAEVISIANPGRTQALEFRDGKLMLGRLESLYGLTWERLLEHVPVARWLELCGRAQLLAMNNWTMIPAMTDIWRRFLAEVAPQLPPAGTKRIAFFDLADPQKRSAAELREALHVLEQFRPYFTTYLGLNRKEAAEVGRALGLGDRTEPGAPLEEATRAIADALDVDGVIVHPTDRASACAAGRYVEVEGPYTPTPKLTTGAGDNFNAGCCLGLALGLDVQDALSLGVATSGWYVRHGTSPTFPELLQFLSSPVL
ncbi:MAG: PfkB family carbohydrate kinase [Bacillota bacterium]